jgi:hypothetical protein
MNDVSAIAISEGNNNEESKIFTNHRPLEEGSIDGSDALRQYVVLSGDRLSVHESEREVTDLDDYDRND